jgi:uncharacterized protein
MRVAAIGDLHCGVRSHGRTRRLLAGVEKRAEVLLVAGDLTHMGRAEEMHVLLTELESVDVPIVAVMGNHDHEGGQAELLVAMLKSAGIHVLSDEVWELDGVAFIGGKGFCGGFGRWHMAPFGEQLFKDFVQETVEAAQRLESALTSSDCSRRVAMLHYAPIADTLRGEHPEIFPFLGSSLFAEALDRHPVDFVVHGHAHYGSAAGATPGGIPVYNVSRQVQSRLGRPAYLVLEV